MDNTDHRRDFYANYAKHLANRMGLQDWAILVSRNPPENPNHNADADCRFGRKTIIISFSESFFRDDEGSQRATVCHELLHAHFAPMHQVVIGKMKGGNGATYNAFLSDFEYGIDGVAEAWAKTLPSVSEFKAISDKYDEAQKATVETVDINRFVPPISLNGNEPPAPAMMEVTSDEDAKMGIRTFMDRSQNIFRVDPKDGATLKATPKPGESTCSEDSSSKP